MIMVVTGVTVITGITPVTGRYSFLLMVIVKFSLFFEHFY